MDEVQQAEGKNGRVSAKAHRVYGPRRSSLPQRHSIGFRAHESPSCTSRGDWSLRKHLVRILQGTDWGQFATLSRLGRCSHAESVLDLGRPCAAAGDGGWP